MKSGRHAKPLSRPPCCFDARARSPRIRLESFHRPELTFVVPRKHLNQERAVFRRVLRRHLVRPPVRNIESSARVRQVSSKVVRFLRVGDRRLNQTSASSARREFGKLVTSGLPATNSALNPDERRISKDNNNKLLDFEIVPCYMSAHQFLPKPKLQCYRETGKTSRGPNKGQCFSVPRSPRPPCASIPGFFAVIRITAKEKGAGTRKKSENPDLREPALQTEAGFLLP